MANRVEVFDPCAPSPGNQVTTRATAMSDSVAGSGATTWLRSGRPTPRSSSLTIGRPVPEEARRQGQFPPFSPDHLENSLAHLAELVTS